MATAKKVSIEITSVVPGFSLELSADEAAILVTILERVGGDVTGSRKHSNSVYNALLDAGSRGRSGIISSANVGSPNTIYFNDGTKP